MDFLSVMAAFVGFHLLGFITSNSGGCKEK